MDSAPDTLCVALDVEDKSDDQNGPRSEQQFECAYCDYASHYYNNFMNHINNNHIESDEEAWCNWSWTFSIKTMNYRYVLLSYHWKYTDLIWFDLPSLCLSKLALG